MKEKEIQEALENARHKHLIEYNEEISRYMRELNKGLKKHEEIMEKIKEDYRLVFDKIAEESGWEMNKLVCEAIGCADDATCKIIYKFGTKKYVKHCCKRHHDLLEGCFDETWEMLKEVMQNED